MSVDTLMEEVARLKAELTHQSALWQTALGHAAEQDARIKDLVADREAVDEALEGVRQQRNALADALLGLRTDVVVSGLSARIRDRARERGTDDPIGIADIALRLSGRI